MHPPQDGNLLIGPYLEPDVEVACVNMVVMKGKKGACGY